MIYLMRVYCVDGSSYFSLGSSDKKRVLEFLEKTDHEGSALQLVINPYLSDERIIDEPEKIYEELKGLS